jgi:class 3 adenylate cyclase
MNVAARLCEHCKAIDRRLVVSDDALRLMTLPADLVVGDGKSIAVRGRQERVEVHVIEPRA